MLRNKYLTDKSDNWWNESVIIADDGSKLEADILNSLIKTHITITITKNLGYQLLGII